MSRRGSTAPGEVLLHPVALASLALLVLNDHALKAALPGIVTGKLSDFAGLAFFPLLLLAGWELLLAMAGRGERPIDRELALVVAVTAAWFTLAKTLAPVAETTGWVLGAAQWLIGLLPRALSGAPIPGIERAIVVVDPTDLVALVALAIPLWLGRRRAGRTRPIPAVRAEPAAST